MVNIVLDMRIALAGLLTVAGLTLTGCRGVEPGPGGPETAAAEGVILETDVASSLDDLFAMYLLYRAEDRGRYDFKAVMVNREGAQNARFADIMNCYYGHPEVPIGIVRNGVPDPEVFVDYWKMGYPELYPDEPHFETSMTEAELEQLPDAEVLYRRLLAQAEDGSVNIVSIGFATNLARLLQTGPDEYSPLSGVELVRKKVKALYIQAGEFGDDPAPDYNFRQDPENAKTLVSLWPTTVYFSPMEAGQPYNYLLKDVVDDLKALGHEDSPIYDAYVHHREDGSQRMWDVVCVLQLLRPELFRLQGPYDAVLGDDMILRLTPNPNGKHYVQEGPTTDAERNQVLKFLRKLIREINS